MRKTPGFTSRFQSWRWSRVLLLAALCAVLGIAQSMAQPQSAAPAANMSCTSNSQCPPNQLCCRACGFIGCTLKACLNPLHGHCPPIP